MESITKELLKLKQLEEHRKMEEEAEVMQKAKDEMNSLSFPTAYSGYYYDPNVISTMAANNLLTSGSYGTMTNSGYGVTTTTASSPVYTTGYPQSPSYYTSTEDGWGNIENQQAAGLGWVLLLDSSAYPRLASLSFGAKSAMTDQEVLTDVIEQAMSGGCPIAYKILCVLTRNRSPYVDWAKTVEALAESYDSSK